MNSLNSVLFEGKLTDKPIIQSMPNGSTLCVFTVESYRYTKNGDNVEKEVSYFNVETWGGLGDRCGGELDKGRGVRVVGRMKQEIDDIEGIAYSKIWIIAERVEFKTVLSTP